MDLSKMNEDWQNEAPTLAAMDKTNPFTVPDGYFEKMSSDLNSQIYISNIDHNRADFAVPEGYFESLTETITSRIRLEALTENTDTVFTVPENYFADLENKINTRIGNGKKEKNIIKKLSSSWITYAAAACITAVVGLSLYFNTVNQNINKQLAEVPAEEIVDYLQLYSDAGDAPMIIENLGDRAALSELNPKISNDEIKQYLESNL